MTTKTKSLKQHRSSKHEFDRQFALDETRRYGLMTREALAIRMKTSEHSAKTILDSLADDGELAEYSLYRNRRFYTCSANTGESTSFRPASETMKIRAYAMLAVCLLSESRRTKLTRSDFAKYFDGLLPNGRPENYYVDSSGSNPTMGFLRVDMGGHGRWDRIVAKARDDFRYHTGKPQFQQLVKRGQLEVRIVTALRQKADRIRQALNESDRQKFTINVTAIPELINLIAPFPSTRIPF